VYPVQGGRLKGINAFDRAEVELTIESYAASGGTEDFISLELPEQDGLVGFVRLRRGEGTDAMVRELKVFGADGQDRAGRKCSAPWLRQGVAGRSGTKSFRQRFRFPQGDQRGWRSQIYASLGYVRKGPYMAKRL